MRISKSLLVAAATLATASLAQAQQNVTGATWVGPALGGSGTWERWTGVPAHNYWTATSVAGNPLVSGARLTNTATLTFQYNGPVLAETPEGAYPTQTVDILYDSSNVSSQSQTLRFFSSGYRLLPGAFNTSVTAEPTAANFTDIDLVRSPALAPYLTTPNGTLQLGTVTFTTASPVLATDPKPFVVLRNTTTADRITVTNAGTVAILENLVASTISGAFRGDGDLRKTGGGVLQYQGSAGSMFNYSVALPYSYIQTPLGFFLSNPGTNNIYGLRPIDLSPNVPTPDPTNGNNWRLSGLQGRVQVDAGLLMVSGHLNMWHDYGARVESQILAPFEIPTLVNNISLAVADADSIAYALAKRMTGVSSIVLNGSAELSFTNTSTNVGGLRLNFAHNLQAGDNNDQFQTTVTTGPDASYRLGIHIDQDFVGSVGILAGSGKVIKTGAGTLRVLNDSRMTGDFIAAGGTIILESATGLTFANSGSFNIAGTQDTADFNGAQQTEGALGLSRRGANIRYAEVASNSNNYPRWDYRPALFPDTGTLTVQRDGAGQFISYANTGAEVILRNDQTVRNFQADFALRSKGTTNIGGANAEVYTAVDAVRTAADVSDKNELVIAGTGVGATLRLDGHTLTINQDAGRDGFFAGNIFGYDSVNNVPGGRIVKTGAGTLVLLLAGGSSYDETLVLGGTFIANAQGLGQKQVFIGDNGTFAILQNNSGTLSANLAGSAGSTLKLLASAVLDNGSGAGIQVNPGLDPGELNVINAQDQFRGSILVNDGVDLSFSGGRNNTFINATAVTLDSGSARETVLRFGDTNQLIRNLAGNASARVELGRGDITLEQNASLAYAGFITGVGSLIKQGTAGFTLAGTTGTNLFKDAYYGATIVRPGGALIAGTANATPNTSALVLVGAGTYTQGNQDQVVGALFGSASSFVNLGTGNLTVGYTSARAASLTTALQGSNPLLADYLGTTTQFDPILPLQPLPVQPTGVAGELGSTSLALSSVADVGVGQIIGGPALDGGTYVTKVIAAGSTAVAGTIAAGLTALPTTDASGLSVGQIITGTGIAADTVITAITGNNLTLSKPLAGVATGAVTGLAGVELSAPLVAPALNENFAVLRVRTIDVSSLSLSAAELNQLYTGNLSMPELTSLYLSRVAVGTGIGSYVAPTAAAELAFAATRSFDGRLVGSGALIKIGNEDLNFGGSSPDFTGRVEIAGGTLNLIWATGSNEAPLRNAQYFLTTAPGVLAVTVNDAYDPVTDLTKRTFTAPIVGTGGFVKRGEGYLKLAPGVVVGQTPYTGTTTVQAGWLEMAALATNGPAVFDPLSLGVLGGAGAANSIALVDVTGLSVGQVVVGTGIPAGTSITGILAAGSGTITGTIPTGDTILPMANTAGLSVGQIVTGFGIPFNTTVTAIAPNASVTLSNPLQSAASGVVTGLAGVTLSANLTQAAAGNLSVLSHLVLTTPVDVTYTGAVSGVGQLEIRAGSKVLTAGGSLTHTGGTLVRTGTLLASAGWAGATTGDITVLAGATARLNVQLDKAVTSGAISTNRLIVADVAGLATGQVVVGTGIPQGTTITGINLVTRELTLSAALTAAASGTLQVANDLSATGVFVGAGTVIKEGIGSLTLNTPTTAFAGTFRSDAGTTNLVADNLFGNPNALPVQSVAAVDLRGASVLNVQDGTDQSFRNLSGEAGTSIVFGDVGSVVTLQVDPVGNYSFAGRFQQAAGVTDGTIFKTGTGTLTLAPTAGPNSLDAVVVTAGKLVGTTAGFATADLYVGTDGNVAFHNPTAGTTVTFTNTVLGAEIYQAGLGVGTVGKTGAGIVELTAAADNLRFNVEAGELRLTDSRLGEQDLFTAIIASGATLSLALADDRRIGTLVPPSVSQISGGGILDLRSDVAGVARTVFAYAQPGVATTNLGADITLDVSTLTDITGVTGAAGSILDLGAAAPGRTLSLTQSVDGVFAGDLRGTTDLVIKGTGMLRYTGAALTLPGVATPALNTPNTITVLGGGLGLDVGNLREVNLAADGTRLARLGVMVGTGVDTSYAGVVTGNPGAAELVKLGNGTLDLTAAAILAGSTLADPVFGSYVVKEGTLRATLDAAGLILPFNGASRPIRLEGGTLAVEVSATGGILQSGSQVGSSGNLTVTTNPATLPADFATLTVLGNIGGNVTVDGGTTLSLGSANAPSLLTIDGNVSITGGSTLSGSANIQGNLSVGAGASLAPGYSPGTQVVAGNFTLAGNANMEVTGTPTGVAPNQLFNDSVQFSGTASLTGNLIIERWNAPATTTAPAFGRRFVLFKDTSVDASPTVAESFVNLFPQANISVAPGAGRYLIVEPRADGAFPGLPTSPSEYAVYFVGGADRYAIPGVATGIVNYLQQITKTSAGGALQANDAVFLPSNVAGDANYLNELAARLMLMDDATLATSIRSLQPASLSAIPATIALEQRAETDALQRRLDQRRYDRAGYSVYYNEFFVEATSTRFQGGSGAGAPPFNSTLTGLLGGYMKDLNPWSVAGVTLGASRTTSTLAEGAGSVSGNAFRATAFFSGMLGERRDTVYLDAGVSLGNSTNTSERVTFLGTQRGSPSAMSYGAFARLGAGLATKGGVNFTPFVGLDLVRVSGKSFVETNGSRASDPTSLSVNSYGYTSARASTGTGMTWLSVHEGQMIKFAFDLEAFAEVGGGKTADIEANFGGVGAFNTKTNVAAGSGVRVVPSFTYGPNPDTAYYLTISLEKAGSTQTTGFEAGYRRRF
ncbi:mucin-5B [Opitutia bacterium]|nr:mucin-5B [Opitutae bacterium]